MREIVAKVVTVLFWLCVGVLVHDYAHALWQIGGIQEVLSLQGGWVALACMVALWILQGSLGFLAYMNAAKYKIMEEVSKGTLGILGVNIVGLGIKLIQQSLDVLAVGILASGAALLIAFAYWVSREIEAHAASTQN
ncbi:MAG: hypothetical protein DRJ47_08655 [Thermoprotei archaeon]|nr:MAG: hypothetical protein DRJ47_08655 [Thermoprotei archaeon]